MHCPGLHGLCAWAHAHDCTGAPCPPLTCHHPCYPPVFANHRFASSSVGWKLRDLSGRKSLFNGLRLCIAAHALLTATVTTCEAADSSGSENGNGWRARTTLQSAVTHALDEAESIVKLLAQRRDPSPEMCAHFIVSSSDAISALLHRVNNLELEVEEQGSEIARLELQVMQMQQQLNELRGETRPC